MHGLANPAILETYHLERHDHVASMIHFSSWLGQIVMPRSRLLALLCDLYFHLVNTVSYTRMLFSELRIGDFLRQDQRLHLLVRPDRYILGAFHKEEARKFIDALQRLLQGEGENKHAKQS